MTRFTRRKRKHSNDQPMITYGEAVEQLLDAYWEILKETQVQLGLRPVRDTEKPPLPPPDLPFNQADPMFAAEIAWWVQHLPTDVDGNSFLAGSYRVQTPR